MMNQDSAGAGSGIITPTTLLLSGMMFLQFFIWGAWYVTVGNYMGAQGMGDVLFRAYQVGPIAAILSPFFLGMVADRYFSSERVLGIMHLLGGLAMLCAPFAARYGAGPFLTVLLIHMLCYTPTLGLSNTVAFHNLSNQEKQFPLVRVFGTLGWIVANIVVSRILHADRTAEQFYVTGGAALLLGLFSFVLPHTPPPAKGQKAQLRSILGIDALKLMKSPSFAIFIISSFLICIPLAAYYNYAPRYVDGVGFANPAFTMSFGQVAEVFFMLIMPLFFAILGVKWMLLVGMAAWVARYGLFSAAAEGHILWMVVIGILLHGICYDFFFVTGFIYADKKAGRELRGQAQGLLVLVTQGLGMLLGAEIIGRIVARYTPPAAQALQEQVKALNAQAVGLTEAAAKPLLEQAQTLDHQVNTMIQWQSVWLIPCLMAAVVMVAFLLLFRDDGKASRQAA